MTLSVILMVLLAVFFTACGDPQYTITSGDSSVLIDGKPAARVGESQVQFAGGVGKIIEGGY